MKVLLASASPRRRELIKRVFSDFDCASPDVDENFFGNSPEETAITIALRKAQSMIDSDYDLIIGCDTLVYYDGIYYGKPKTSEEAEKFLKKLSGKTHTVVSGLALLVRNNKKDNYSASTGCETSCVTFKTLSESDIKNYIKTHNVMDKAGAYAIQDGVVVENYSGEYENIIGLPIRLLKELVEKIAE